MGVTGEFKQSDSIVDEGILGVLEALHLPQAPRSFLAPCGCHPIMHVRGNATIKVIDVQGLKTLGEAISFATEAIDCFQPLPAPVPVGLSNRPFNEFKNLIIHSQAGEFPRECFSQLLFPNVSFRAFLLEP